MLKNGEVAIGDSDIPRRSTTSSVGAVEWPPAEASENRKKGIFARVIEGQDDLMQLLRDFDSFPFDEATTRYSARIFVSRQALAESIQHEETFQQLNTHAEGLIPLRGAGIAALEDVVMIYLGKNDVTRASDPSDVRAEIDRAREIFDKYSGSKANHNHSTFHFKILSEEDKQDANLQQQYDDLYSAFGWEPSDVAKILTNPHNVLVAAFEGDLLVSAGIGERAELPIERNGTVHPFVIYEVTEAATKEEYRSRGLYTKVATELMHHLAQTDVNMVYAESNTAAPGVLRAAKIQGRHSMLEGFDEFGLQPRLLEQHVRISGGRLDTRPPKMKNDLLVTYLPRQELLHRYGR